MTSCEYLLEVGCLGSQNYREWVRYENNKRLADVPAVDQPLFVADCPHAYISGPNATLSTVVWFTHSDADETFAGIDNSGHAAGVWNEVTPRS